jgi:hypothetical protein
MNNPEIYNAALAGVIGGASTSRNNPNTNPSDYESIASICEAFALEIDSRISKVEEVTDIMIDAMIQICAGYWTNRSPRSVVPESYVTECKQIVALWTAIVAKGK